MQIRHLSPAQLTPQIQPNTPPLVVPQRSESPSRGIIGDKAQLSDLRTDSSRKAILYPGLVGLGTGAAVGAGMGYLLPTLKVGSGVALSAAFGAGVGAAAGAGSGVVAQKWLGGKVSTTAAGAGLGVLAGAAGGALMGLTLPGSHKLMTAGFMAIPGAIAGAASGFAAAKMQQN